MNPMIHRWRHVAKRLPHPATPWLLLFFLAVLVCDRTFALPNSKQLDECRIDTWGVRDGLPGNDITSLAQTPDGFLWIGTTQGLYRFDGASFAVYDHVNVPGLTNDTIRSLMVDDKGELWIGAEVCGYGRFSNGVFTPSGFSSSGWNATQYLRQTADGSVWVGFQDVEQRFILRDYGGVQEMMNAPGLYLTGVVSLPHGDYLASIIYGGLFRITTDDRVVKFATNPAFPYNDITSLAQTPNGDIWCATDGHGLFRIRQAHWTQYTTSNGLSSNCVHCLYVDRGGRLWIGTNHGIDSFGPHGFQCFGVADGLASDDVGAITEDLEGDLWVATGFSLNRFANAALTPVRVGPRDTPDINSISAGRNGCLYCSARSGLWSLSGRSYQTPKQVLHKDVKDAISTQGGDMVAWWYDKSNHQVVGRLHAGRWRIWPLDFSPVAMVDAGGEVDIFGEYGDFVRLASNGTISPATSIARDLQIYDVQFQPRGVLGQALAPSSGGVLWLATTDGLMRLENGKAVVVDAGLPPGVHVLSIDASDPGRLWLATDKGVARVDLGSPKTSIASTVYSTADGLPSNDVLQIRLDRRENTLWLGGYFGIAAIHVADLLRPVRTRIPVTLYTVADGIRSYPRVARPARTSDGRLWFVGQSGLTLVDPDDIASNPLRPPVVIEELTVDGHSLAPGMSGKPARIPPGAGSLDVRYAAPSFVEPEKVRFRYRLDGFDKSWNDAGTRHNASYTNLPPGGYRFRVIACNNDGVWNPVGASIRFIILPHYYETAWWRLVVIAFIACSLYALVMLRIRATVRRNRELEVKIAARTAELQETVEHLHESRAEVAAQNDELQSLYTELEAQNESLQEMQVELSKANEHLSTLAQTDGLTGLFNHRTFQQMLQIAWQQTSRSGAPLSVILLDVDRFKQYNDTFGHPEGDEVLKSVANILTQQARASDIVARYGGEEFVVIAANTDTAGVVELAERLRAAIEASPWKLRSVTASFGAATSSPSMSSAADLVKLADTALYASKQQGRNRVQHTAQLPATTLTPPVL